MNRKQHSVVLASMLALALAGCGSMRGSSDMGAGSTDAGIGSSGSSGSGTASSGWGSSGSAATGGTAGGMAGTGSTATSPQAAQTQPAPSDATSQQGAAPNAVVTVIEVVPRPSSMGGSAVGGSGTAGVTGSSTGEDKVYRITLHMDDGTTHIVTQEKAPTFRNGDRVNMTGGIITQ
jgi:hypothetical protein